MFCSSLRLSSNEASIVQLRESGVLVTGLKLFSSRLMLFSRLKLLKSGLSLFSDSICCSALDLRLSATTVQ